MRDTSAVHASIAAVDAASGRQIIHKVRREDKNTGALDGGDADIQSRQRPCLPVHDALPVALH